MIPKTLSVLAIAAAIGTAAVSPLRAQRTPAGQNQAGKAGGKSSTPQNAPQSRPKPWWMDEGSQKELKLTAAQVKAIDDIYMSTKDELAGNKDNLDRERKELDRLIAESKVEQWVVLRQIGRMETERTRYNTTLWMMLYRMNRQLTADQRVKLNEIERRGRDARNGRGGEPRDPKPVR